MKPKVSFTIIAYNEEKNIANCINSILDQGGLRDYEIVIVNDASKDKTAEIVKEFSKKNKRIRLIDLKVNEGRGNARFTGVKNAKGKYIAFIDADIILPKHWLKTCLSEIKKYDAVGGIAVPDGDVNWIWQKCSLEPKIVGHSTIVTGSNGLYRKELFSIVNFDSSMKEGEDFDFNKKLLGKGFKLRLIERLIVEHRESKTYLDSLKWLYQSGKGATRMFKRHKKVRLPDLAFFGFVFLFLLLILEGIFLNSIYTWILFLIYPLFTSFLHIYTRFELKKIFKFIFAVVLNYPLIVLYYLGRIRGFL